jgi:hypothetical protein
MSLTRMSGKFVQGNALIILYSIRTGNLSAISCCLRRDSARHTEKPYSLKVLQRKSSEIYKNQNFQADVFTKSYRTKGARLLPTLVNPAKILMSFGASRC